MTLQTDLETAVAQVQADAAKLHDVVHGDANTTVQTEGGGVKTVAKTIQEIEDTATAAGTGYVSQAQQAAADADADRQAAESAANSAQQSANDAAASAANAAAVVTGGTATLDPQPGMIPLADARGQIAPGWVEPETQEITAQQITCRANCLHAFVYDASLDGDGGEWRHKCAHTSWYQQARPVGQYFGIHASAADAVAAGAGVGDWFLDNSSWNYIEITATSPSITTQGIWRAGRAEFPERVAILTWADRVEIIDLTTPKPSMWMVFKNASYSYPGYSVKSMSAMSDGELMTASDAGVWWLDFARDAHGNINEGERRTSRVSIADQASGGSTWLSREPGNWLPPGLSVGAFTYWVAAKRLPGAPRDEIGRVRPTWAISAAGGLAVHIHGITPELYYSSSWLNTRDSKRCAWGDQTLMWLSVNGFSNTNSLTTQYAICNIPIDMIGNGGFSDLPSQLYYYDTPYRPDGAGFKSLDAYGDTFVIGRKEWRAPVILVRGHHNGIKWEGSRKHELFAYSANWGWTGWMVGSTKWATLIDNSEGTISGSEKIVNGAFDADTDWTKTAASAITGGKGIAESTGVTDADRGCLIQGFQVEAGKIYRIQFKARGLGAGTGNAHIRSTPEAPGVGGTSYVDFNLWGVLDASAAEQTIHREWTATVTGTVYIVLMTSLSAGDQYEFDDVTIREAVTDRRGLSQGGKQRSLAIYGALTKTAIGANNDMVEFAGWSTTDYLSAEYPDTLQLASDFSIQGIIRVASGAVSEPIMGLGSWLSGAFVGAYWKVSINAAGQLELEVSDGTNTDVLTHPAVINDDLRRPFIITREGSELRMRVRGQEQVMTGSAGDLSNPDGQLRVGSAPDGTFFSGGLMMLRLSVRGAPSWQMEHIEREEVAFLNTDALQHFSSTSNNVDGVTIDPVTGRAHLTCAGGRSVMQGIAQVDRYDDAPISQGGSNGHGACRDHVVEVGALGALAYIPRRALREEQPQGRERQNVESSWQVFDMDGTTAEVRVATTCRPEMVTLDGAIQHKGTTRDYTLAFDGWGWVITFATTPAAGSVVGVLVQE